MVDESGDRRGGGRGGDGRMRGGGDRGADAARDGGTPVEYPVPEWDRNVEGVALVRVLVNAEGGVDSAMVAEGSGSAALDSAALRGAWEMEFEPALREGRPLRVWARIPVHFSRPGSEG